MGVYLGIDIGTSGTKTLAIRGNGRILASATIEYPLSSPRPGWSEQDPEHWWEAAKKSVRRVLRNGKIKPASVAGIGLSGQMHGSVFLDSRQRVIRPALLWNDQRTAAECDEIERLAGGRRQLIRMVANPALTGFTAPKILWLRNNEPRHFDRTRQVLLPKDYVRFRLTGEFATEVSDASGTLLLDVRKRRWSRSLLRKLELDPNLLPLADWVCQKGCPWSVAEATRRPGRSETELFVEESSRPRWEPVASSSHTATESKSILEVVCTPFATPSAANGT